MSEHRIYGISFAAIYPHYIAKAERKGHTKDEVDHVIEWLTGYDKDALAKTIATRSPCEPLRKRPCAQPERIAHNRADLRNTR